MCRHTAPCMDNVSFLEGGIWHLFRFRGIHNHKNVSTLSGTDIQWMCQPERAAKQNVENSIHSPQCSQKYLHTIPTESQHMSRATLGAAYSSLTVGCMCAIRGNYQATMVLANNRSVEPKQIASAFGLKTASPCHSTCTLEAARLQQELVTDQ